MFLVIRKGRLLALAGCLVLLSGLALILHRSPAESAGNRETFQSVQSGAVSAAEPALTIVIDPGHGGEDGGAVAADGTVESGLNLATALRVRALLCLCGQQTVMTREEDVSIYSGDAVTLHEKKVSDLKNRVALVNGLPNALLLSIHQNMLPASPSVHGAQVFYNRTEEGQALAAAIQAALNACVNGDGGKTEKQIADSIYLMKNVTAPAVLVECGFLSNPEETERLKSRDWQLRLAIAMTAGLLHGLPDAVPITGQPAGQEQP